MEFTKDCTTFPGSCPVCETAHGNYFMSPHTHSEDYQIYKCSNCGLEYTLPEPSLSTLKAFYANYYDIRADENVVRLNARRNIELINKYFGAGKKTIWRC